MTEPGCLKTHSPRTQLGILDAASERIRSVSDTAGLTRYRGSEASSYSSPRAITLVIRYSTGGFGFKCAFEGGSQWRFTLMRKPKHRPTSIEGKVERILIDILECQTVGPYHVPRCQHADTQLELAAHLCRRFASHVDGRSNPACAAPSLSRGPALLTVLADTVS